MHRMPPDTDPLAAALLRAIFPLFKDGQSEVMAATAKFDLTLSQLRMLFVLDKADADLAINELADRVSLSMAATGRAVDGLVRSGLLLRRDDAADRRIKRIALSPTGNQTIEHIVEARRAAAERFVGMLDDAERAQLAGAVATLSGLTRAHFPHLYASFSTSPSDTSP